MDFLIRLGIPEVQVSLERSPLNIGLVLDRSGSMSGSKLRKAKQALNFCVDQLAPTDWVSIVIFDNEVDVLVPPVPGSERQRLKQALAPVRSRGSTPYMPPG